MAICKNVILQAKRQKERASGNFSLHKVGHRLHLHLYFHHHTGWPVVRIEETLPHPRALWKVPPTPAGILGPSPWRQLSRATWSGLAQFHGIQRCSLSRSPIIMMLVSAGAAWSWYRCCSTAKTQRILLQDVQFSLGFYVALPFWFPYLDCRAAFALLSFLHYFKWRRPPATPTSQLANYLVENQKFSCGNCVKDTKRQQADPRNYCGNG